LERLVLDVVEEVKGCCAVDVGDIGGTLERLVIVAVEAKGGCAVDIGAVDGTLEGPGLEAVEETKGRCAVRTGGGEDAGPSPVDEIPCWAKLSVSVEMEGLCCASEA
jgi:hypothetical protein